MAQAVDPRLELETLALWIGGKAVSARRSQ